MYLLNFSVMVGLLDISANFMFCPRFQSAQEILSSYTMGNYFRKIGRILRGLSKHPDRQNQVQFEFKMKSQ